MKRLFTILLLLASFGLIYAQVGINTENPAGIFHIDPKSDTNGTSNTSDDVVIDINGNLGLGTTTPQSKLEVHGNIVIKDGTEANGKVLVSDANGKGRWEKVGDNGKTALWTLTSTTGQHFPVTDNPNQLKDNAVASITEDVNEIGLAISASDPYSITVPAGLYFIIIEHDLTAISEYGDFQVRPRGSGTSIYTIYYKEKLSGGSFIYNFTTDTDIMVMAGYRSINVSGFTRYARNTGGTHLEPFRTQLRFIRLR